MSAIDELNLKFMNGSEVLDCAVVTLEEWRSVVAEAEQLRARVAECEQALVNTAAWLEADTNEIARDIWTQICDPNDIYESTAHCIENIIAPVLANQIEGGE